MYRMFVVAAAIAAVSAPAFAKDVTVSLTGKSKAEVLAEIHNAAQTVCLADGYQSFDEQIACTTDVEQAALADLAKAYEGMALASRTQTKG